MDESYYGSFLDSLADAIAAGYRAYTEGEQPPDMLVDLFEMNFNAFRRLIEDDRA